MVKGLRTNLLGLPAIVSLNLVAHLGAATVGNFEVLEEFSSLFEGLGNLREPYDIKLKPDAKPYVYSLLGTFPFLCGQRLKRNFEGWRNWELSQRSMSPLHGVQE